MYRLARILTVVAVAASTQAAPHSAKLTQSYGEVSIGEVGEKSDARPAQVQEVITAEDFLRTGMKSRAELQFTDQTFLRVGSNSVFTFAPAKNNFILKQGEGLLVFPKGQGGAKVQTAALTAGILGTTIYVTSKPGEFTYSCLEGRCTVGAHTLNPGERVIIRGSGTPYTAAKQSFNIRGFMKTNSLITGFKNTIPSLKLIEAEAAKQK
jgi:hypothetical protein